ncbi:MAG: DUF3786 domain-containing protein [Planctomycetota bacterium]|nr:DUF3786 domain-containing protein [Planctomycetota bacterium]
MTQGKRQSTWPSAVPPQQHNFEDAAGKALALLCKQPAEQLKWLGGQPAGDLWIVPVLNDEFSVDPAGGTVLGKAGQAVGRWWRILTLHYLAVSSRPPDRPPAVTFADLPAGRAYGEVYRQRVIEQLVRKVGPDTESLRRAGCALGGRAVAAGDAAFDFQVYPRVRFRVIWYAGDTEFAPSATLLMPDNVESFFCTEDIVVLSERLISRMASGPF